jgi:hypothetical protein
VIDWLLVDYGEVLSTAPPEVAFTELAAIAGLKRDEFFQAWPNDSPSSTSMGGAGWAPKHCGRR